MKIFLHRSQFCRGSLLNLRSRLVFTSLTLFLVLISFLSSESSPLTAAGLFSTLEKNMEKKGEELPFLPNEFPQPGLDGVVNIVLPNSRIRSLTLVGELQKGLQQFIMNNGNPIASVVIVDAKTGQILAMAQGRTPKLWDSKVHTALYSGFPAASLFKLVTTTAALQVAQLDPDEELSLHGGCSDVHPRGLWLADFYAPTYNAGPLTTLTRSGSSRKHKATRPYSNRGQKMTLSRAFASSCNGFYAELVVKRLGLGMVSKFAEKFAWGRKIPSDFAISESPIYTPTAESSNIHTVGMFAAGFGMVGMSAVHAAWLTLMIANDGRSMPLKIFSDTVDSAKNPFLLNVETEPLFDKQTGLKLRHMMNGTVRSGTARGAFSKRGYRGLVDLVGGKTGTLNGEAPKGQTTWFTGLSPIDDPQIIVSSIVVNDSKWVIKGSQLAAEAFKLWYQYNAAKKINNSLHSENVAPIKSTKG